MSGLLAEIWVCVSLAALLGVVAGWLVWGRHSQVVLASYRGRLARLRENWETVEEHLTEALDRVSALERELDQTKAELDRSEDTLEHMRGKEEVWRDERRSLEDRLRKLDERILDLEPRPGVPGTSRPQKSYPRSD
jgi:chromosome segregation ATPase